MCHWCLRDWLWWAALTPEAPVDTGGALPLAAGELVLSGHHSRLDGADGRVCWPAGHSATTCPCCMCATHIDLSLCVNTVSLCVNTARAVCKHGARVCGGAVAGEWPQTWGEGHEPGVNAHTCCSGARLSYKRTAMMNAPLVSGVWRGSNE